MITTSDEKTSTRGQVTIAIVEFEVFTEVRCPYCKTYLGDIRIKEGAVRFPCGKCKKKMLIAIEELTGTDNA